MSNIGFILLGKYISFLPTLKKKVSMIMFPLLCLDTTGMVVLQVGMTILQVKYVYVVSCNVEDFIVSTSSKYLI